MKKLTLLCPLLILAGCSSTKSASPPAPAALPALLSDGDSPIIITDGSIHFKKANLAQSDLSANGSQATLTVDQNALLAVVVKGCTDQSKRDTCTTTYARILGSATTPAPKWLLTIYHTDNTKAAILKFDSGTPTIIQLTAPRPTDPLAYKSLPNDDYDGGYSSPKEGLALENLKIAKAGLSFDDGKTETPIPFPSAGKCRIKIGKF